MSEFYASEGTDYKTQVLKNEYPDVVQVTTKYGRIHHHIDYVKHYNSRFEPMFRTNSEDPEYGLYLKSDERADFYPQCLI